MSRGDGVFKSTVFALLVGINQYQGDVPALTGCVNDVKAMQQYLESRSRDGYFYLELDILTSGDPQNPGERKPTRQAVINGFRNILGKAGEGDTALFYFSGHGSQEKAPPQFWHLEPDHLDETLVCYDSRTPGNWDLADKELAVLIAEVAQKDGAVEPPHVVVILDSCHSGSGTRDPQGSRARLAPQDARDRPIETFLPELTGMIRSQNEQLGPVTTSGSNWIALPAGRHVVLSACRAEESAREKGMRDGQTHGVFSFYLLDTIRQVGPALTYRDIFSRASSLVRGQVKDQNPILESVQAGDIMLPFLGGKARPDTQDALPYFDLYYEKDQGWFINGGAVHGIQPPTGSETTHLKVFPLEQPIRSGESLENALGDAQVIQVLGTRSRVLPLLKDGKQPGLTESFKTVVVASPLVPCPVYISGTDKAAMEPLKAAVTNSLLLEVVEDATNATLRLNADLNSNEYRLQRAADLQPLQVVVKGKGTPQALDDVVAKLEHMASWLQKLELENRQSGISPDAIQMEVFKYNPNTGERWNISAVSTGQASPGLVYNPEEGEWGVPIQIRIHHTGAYPKELYVMLVDMTEDYAVLTGDFLFGGGTWLKPGEETWATDPSTGDSYIYASVRPELVSQGVTRFTDVLKLVISTDASNAHLLAQERLQVAVRGSATRGGFDDGAVPPSSLHRLMQRVRTRDLGGSPPRGKLSDWRTITFSITTECFGGEVPLAESPGTSTEIAPGVMIEGHPEFKAKAQLVPFESGKRDLGNLSMPAVFRNHPDQFQPFALSSGESLATRGETDTTAIPAGGGDAGNSVIVLSEVAGRESVSPENPLVLNVQASLKPTEMILPVGFDPQDQLYLPLGIGWQDGNQVKITITHLPAPTSDSRSVSGSIKLFFQKLVAEKTGLEVLSGKTNRLAAAWCTKEGEVECEDDPQVVREKVADAGKILLLLHGLFGDTQAMVKSFSSYLVEGTKSGGSPSKKYDLLLAFDYENIYTPIEETAMELKKQLVDIAGLAPGHGKTLHIVAHSLGTQVVRYFIERDEGSQIVQKAVLAGAPNSGTPWAVYEDYAVYAIAAALNGLVALVSGPAAIATLVGSLVSVIKGVEEVDTTLDQLKPGSQFYKILNASGDPHVPYHVIAGNTLLIQYNQPDRQEAEKGALARLVEKVTSPKTRHNILSLGFFNKPNDIAVSLESQLSLPQKRNPQPQQRQVACDHLSYFSGEAGLRAIVDALTSGE